MLDDEWQISSDWFKHDDLGVMVDELVIGLYCEVLHHLVQVGRLNACDGLVGIDLIQGIQKLFALKIGELPND